MILGFIGTAELILIGGIALLLVGGKKLPEMMRGLGKGVKEFKDGMREINDPITSDSAKENSMEITNQNQEPLEESHSKDQ